jgi:hypothetical protein
MWRPEYNSREFDHLFASCNCNPYVTIIELLLISFECSMTVKSSRDINLIVNDRLFKCDRTVRTRFVDLPILPLLIDRFSLTLVF